MTQQQGKSYSLDANALIYAWAEAYRPESFESFWTKMDGLSAEGRVRISEEVYEELRRKDDGLYGWISARPQVLVPDTDAVQARVTAILQTHALLVKARKNRSGADPFVIAVAQCEGATVVTQEGFGSPQTPKIPDVCRAYGVAFQRLGDLIRDEGWRF
jgi:hypothetical protein